MSLFNFVLPREGWQVSIHKHVPLSDPVDVASSDAWEWRRADLPFDALTWLTSQGIIEDPLISRNDLSCKWVEFTDWALRCVFEVPMGSFCEEDELLLFLTDLDCYAAVFLNGNQIGKTRNQFRAHYIEVENVRCESKNELLIYIRSAQLVNAVLEQAHGILPAAFDTGRVHARRMQCLTGWDWTSRLSSASLLSSPELRVQSDFSIASVFASTIQIAGALPMQACAELARIAIMVEVAARRKGSGQLLIQIVDPQSGQVVAEAIEQITLKARTLFVKVQIEVTNPRVWWPLGFGEQSLYKVAATLTATDRIGNEYTCTADDEFGVRTVGLDRQKEGDGELFRPIVNGQPIFCRGVNWVPTTMLPAQRHDDDYRLLLSTIAQAGMNCVRVWGGGTYETDLFYKLCDRLGLLVWQDFMFSCAAYPVYRQFVDEVELESSYQIIRLRNHPCIMLWCGNNEIEWLHQVGQLRRGNEQHVIGERLWADHIKAVCEEHDPSRPYHQSSPFGRNRLDPNDEYSGDRHSWDAWSGWESPHVYLQDFGRFITEFGFQALPALSTIAKFAPSADSFEHHELAHRQKMIAGQERLARYVAEMYCMPRTLAEWVDTTQTMQAEVLGRAVEHWRRNRQVTSGTIIWQSHDAYPAISWSLIDYDRQPKLAWHHARRFFSPIMLTSAFYIGQVEYGAVPINLWAYPDEQCPLDMAGYPDIPQKISPGDTIVSIRIKLINDTGLELSGKIKIRLYRDGEEPVLIEIHALSISANSESSEIVKEFKIFQLQPVQSLKFETVFIPDPSTSERLDKLEHLIRDTNLSATAVDYGFPLFSIREGLVRTADFVEPKYVS